MKYSGDGIKGTAIIKAHHNISVMVSESPKSLEVQSPQKMDQSDPKPDNIDTSSDKPPKPKSPTAENTEEAPEVSTSTCTADDVVQKKSLEETALILSAEEEGELCTTASEEAVKEQPKPVKVPTPKKLKKDGSKNLWVSNISRSTKASDLKKLFSENFKVESAKIVTNGKSFFGYISLETAEMVQKAVKDLNAVSLAGRSILVSLTRPDQKAARVNVGEQTKRAEKQKQLNFTDNQKPTENKQEQEEKTESSKKNVKDSNNETVEKTVEKKANNQVIKPNPEEKVRKPHRQDTKADRRDMVIENLKKEVNTANSELRITKRRLRDSEKRLEFERSRKSELIADVSKLEAQLKMERSKIEQEREHAERKRKIDQSRFDDDKMILNKELEECKKLREYLQTKVDEMRTTHRSRSPIRRSPVRRAGPGGRSLPGHGGMNKMERPRMLHISPPKQRGYDGAQDRQCIAPSPPKINKRSPLRRSRDRSPPYKGIKKPRIAYTSTYSSGPSGGIKAPLDHFHTAASLDAPSRSVSWTSSYKMPYRYNSTPGQSAYPLVGGEAMHAPRFNSARPEYPEYHKRVLGVPRKY